MILPCLPKSRATPDSRFHSLTVRVLCGPDGYGSHLMVVLRQEVDAVFDTCRWGAISCLAGQRVSLIFVITLTVSERNPPLQIPTATRSIKR